MAKRNLEILFNIKKSSEWKKEREQCGGVNLLSKNFLHVSWEHWKIWRLKSIKLIFTIRIQDGNKEIFLKNSAQMKFPWKDFFKNLCLHRDFFRLPYRNGGENFPFNASFAETKVYDGERNVGVSSTHQIRIYGSWLLIFNILFVWKKRWRGEDDAENKRKFACLLPAHFVIYIWIIKAKLPPALFTCISLQNLMIQSNKNPSCRKLKFLHCQKCR